MTVEELTLENERLNGRLKKAIQVFNEQKATINRLTEERDSANAEIEKLKSRISELEKSVAENSENDSKFFEQIQEIDDLKTKVSQLQTN